MHTQVPAVTPPSTVIDPDSAVVRRVASSSPTARVTRLTRGRLRRAFAP